MATSSDNEIFRALQAAGRQDLVDQLKSKDGWKAVSQAKLVYFDVIANKTELSFDEVLTMVDMDFIPLLTSMDVVPKTVGNARDILTKMRDAASAEGKDHHAMLIQRIINITNERATDIDVLDGMSASIEVAEADEVYSQIVSECSNFIVKSMAFMEEPIDVELVEKMQSINV